MYKYEMHLHTADVSPCADATHEQVAQVYRDFGYTGVNITNHWSREVIHCMNLEGKSIGEQADFFMDSYKKLCEASGDELSVFCGVEIDLEPNEYLVYNIDRDFLIDLGKNFYKLSPGELAGVAHDHGCLIYRSHPFRSWLNVTGPDIFRTQDDGIIRNKVDGIEAVNYSNDDYFSNDTALLWAETYKLKTITGSDYHGSERRYMGGIYTEQIIHNSAELIDILQNDRYALVLPDDYSPIMGELHPKYRFMTDKR